MTKKQENLTYLLLGLVGFTLLVYLVIDAATAYRGEDVTPELEEGLVHALDDDPGGADSRSIFERRDLFFPIITPEPTPTREIKPTPTPTPIPFANWKVKMLLPPLVSVIDESGKMVHLEQGDEHFGCLILEVNSDGIVVEYQGDGLGRTKVLKKEGVK